MAALDIPFLSGYMTMDATNRGIENNQLGQAEKFMTLQGAMEDRAAKRAALQREASFRASITPEMTEKQILEAGIRSGALSAKDLVTTLQGAENKRLQADTQRSIATERLRQQADAERRSLEVRWANAKTMQEKNRIQEEANQAVERHRQIKTQIEAGNYNYNTGGFVDTSPMVFGGGGTAFATPAPATAEAQVPQQSQMLRGTAPNEQAVMDSISPALQARQKIPPFSIEIPSDSPSAQYASPAAAVAAPSAVQQPVAPTPGRAPLQIAPLTRAQGGLAPDVTQDTPAGGPVAGSQTVVPQPGQGVPGVRAQMPAFKGSPKEVARAQNEWLADQAKADRAQESKNAKIGVNVAGGRESVFINRVVNSGNQAVADLENVAKLPMSSSRGIFGGRSQGKSLFDASKETLATELTSQEVQTYNVVATGFQRALAAIEGMGLAPTNALMHQMDGVIFKEGDTNFTKVLKLSQIRQIVEKGLETVIANQRVDAETKKLAQNIVDKAIKAVPFTPGQVIELGALQQQNPNATLKDVMEASKAQQGAPTWDEAKERRYQELKAKQGR